MTAGAVLCKPWPIRYGEAVLRGLPSGESVVCIVNPEVPDYAKDAARHHERLIKGEPECC